jgi:hypothetical protein
MVVATIAVGARGVSSLGAPSSSPDAAPAIDASSPTRPEASPTAGGSAAPTATATPAAATGSQPAPTATGTPAPAAAAPAAAAPAAAAPDVGRIADAERESRRWAEEAQDTVGDGDERLTQELRETSYAYRDAVTAGTAGDAAAFTAALDKADRLAQQASIDLDGN